MAKPKSAPKSQAQLVVEYSTFPDDQPVSEYYAAARLAKSRAWAQWKRVVGDGPRFHRTDSGKIFYIKSDVEAYLTASLTAYNNTSQYPTRVAQGGAR